MCTRYGCVALDLPPHTHVRAPIVADGGHHRWAATDLETVDVDRVLVDWRAVARELWTGRRDLPPAGHQLQLCDNPIPTMEAST